MTRQHTRSTFLTIAQLIECCIDACTVIAAQLDSWAEAWPHDERARLLAAKLSMRQLELRADLQAYLEDAPRDVLQTRTQYVADFDVGESELPDDTALVLRQVLIWTGQLERCFAEQQAKTPAPAVCEAYAALREVVRQKMKQMSKDGAGSESL
jgi:hypothetical protein